MYLHVYSYSQSLNHCVIAYTYIKYISLRRAINARFWFTFQSRFHLESSPVVYGSGFLEASEWEVRLWQKIRQISLMATPARISHSQIDPVNTKHIFCCFCFCFCCNVNKRSQFFIDVVPKRLISTWYTMYKCMIITVEQKFHFLKFIYHQINKNAYYLMAWWSRPF